MKAEPYGNHGFSRGGRVIFVLYSVSERQVGAENGEKYRKQCVASGTVGIELRSLTYDVHSWRDCS